jgi:hypothetical protein
VRDGLIDRNPARISGWQREYKLAEDDLDDPRSLARGEGLSIRELAERHGVHRRTVRPTRASRPSTLLRQPDLNS